MQFIVVLVSVTFNNKYVLSNKYLHLSLKIKKITKLIKMIANKLHNCIIGINNKESSTNLYLGQYNIFPLYKLKL